MKKRILILSFLLCICFSVNAIAVDPVLIDCPVNIWTKVATNTNKADIAPTTKSIYFYTLRDTDGAAPDNDNDALLLSITGVKISVRPAVDIYVKARTKAGTVRVATFSDTVIVSGSVIVTDSALPSGASTSANQDIIISSHGDKLDRIDTNITSSGTKLDAIQSSVELVRITDPLNSTTSTLGNSEVFTGEWVDVLGYSSVIVNVLTDEDSAILGLEVEGSDNASEVIHNHQFTVESTDPLGQHYVFTLVPRYYRIIYTNGTTPQTLFNLNAVLSKLPAIHSHTHPIEFPITGNHEAQLGRTVLVAKTAAGPYANIEATNGANLKVSLEELESGISVNSNTQLRITEFNSVGSELWDTAAHAGYTKITDGSTITSISNNNLHVKVNDAIPSGNNNIGAIEVVDPNDDTRRMAMDALFRAPLIQQIEHFEIHEGCAFIARAFDENMSIGDEIILAFKTPNTLKVPHIIIDFSAKASSHVDIIESPVWSTGTGSQVLVYNRNRNSTNTTDLLEDSTGSFINTNTILLNPNNLSGGTIIPNGTLYVFTPMGIGQSTKSRGESETILKANTQYAIRFTTDSGVNGGDLMLRWYEHAQN